MEKNLKKFGFTIGIFDNITEKIKKDILEESKQYETFAVGIFTDSYIINNLFTYPLKTIEERIKMVEELEGVSFTFSVDSSDTNENKEKIEKAYAKFIKQ